MVANLLILGLLGCGLFNGPATTAATIANEIGGRPATAEAVLKKHNLSPKRLEDMMYLIALDEDMSQSYIGQLDNPPR